MIWSRGYEATSMRELTDSIEITEGSLYNAFDDKRSLYRRSLDYYIERGFCQQLHRLEGQLPPRECIVAFFDEVVSLLLGDPQRSGCLIVNSALEVAPQAPESRQLWLTQRSRWKRFSTSAVERVSLLQRSARSSWPPMLLVCYWVC